MIDVSRISSDSLAVKKHTVGVKKNLLNVVTKTFDSINIEGFGKIFCQDNF